MINPLFRGRKALLLSGLFEPVKVVCQMADSNEHPLQKLSPSIVEIISGKEGEDPTTLGTGFVVTDD